MIFHERFCQSSYISWWMRSNQTLELILRLIKKLIFSEPFVAGGMVGVSRAVAADGTERSRLQTEVWFHGSISRQQAEQLLKQVIYSCQLSFLIGEEIHSHFNPYCCISRNNIVDLFQV